MKEYQVVGRMLPSPTNPSPKLYRMRLFAPNDLVAQSRFWHFLKKLRRVKRSNGELVSCCRIHNTEAANQVSNYGVWVRYDSRSGTHNMYKEYRDVSRSGAVSQCYQDMAARHRARFSCIQIIRVAMVKTADVRRQYTKQLCEPKLRFPLPHRVLRSAKRQYKSLYLAKRPSTHF